jgi:hypothetical protein
MDKQQYKRILNSELEQIKQVVIWKDDNGECHLFSRYKVRTLNNKHIVSKYDTDIRAFDRLLSAISWCVADNMGRYDVSTEIKRLDALLTTMADDVYVRTDSLKNCKDSEQAEIIRLKIDTKNQQKREVEEKLKYFFKETKAWQSRGFTNELKRSSSSTTC